VSRGNRTPNPQVKRTTGSCPLTSDALFVSRNRALCARPRRSRSTRSRHLGARPHHLCRQAIDFREGLRGGRVLTDNRGLPPLVRAVGLHNAKRSESELHCRLMAGDEPMLSLLELSERFDEVAQPERGRFRIRRGGNGLRRMACCSDCAVKPAGTMRTFPSLIARR
jgi:hypothetical protein